MVFDHICYITHIVSNAIILIKPQWEQFKRTLTNDCASNCNRITSLGIVICVILVRYCSTAAKSNSPAIHPAIYEGVVARIDMASQ
ncbi:hypothetical protein CEXT_232651 [Caerostris extrusa]|uniref:Uncharacterized protein n=1 Tax=Caerostris extrusa TaxID=172846 RepID=A0AAV4TBK9_CAEEX|nr:hypothetical protein CEXT_232651 [Caerostris extrusa]